jgi:uncharacterized protein YegL
MSDTIVTFLLDKSGSMETIKENTIDGFNAYLTELRKSTDNIFMSLLQFDTYGIEKTFTNCSVKEAPDLIYGAFTPRGGTPLIDAAYKTIKAVEGLVKDATTKVVICIMTDGEENSSTEYDYPELAALIAEKTKLGWQFNFMGSGFDAYQQSAKLGLSAGQTMAYSATDLVSNKRAFAASAGNTRSYASGESINTNYTPAQKDTVGDQYAQKYYGSKSQPTSPVPDKAGPRKKPVLIEDFTL